MRRLVALALVTALMPLNSTMIAVALPAIGRDVGSDLSALTQWLVTSYLIVGIVCQGPAGKLGDRFGHPRMLVIGQAIFATGCVTGFFAHGVFLLTLARVLMSMGAASISPSAVALVRLQVRPERRGRAFGAFGAVMGLAAAIGPVLGGELTRSLGWRSVFLVSAPFVITAALLARGERARASPPRPHREARRFDVIGTLILGASLTALVLGTTARGGLVLAVLGAVGLVIVFSNRRRVDDPVIDPLLFREGTFAAGAAVVALQNFAMYALLFELPAYLVATLHFDAARAGRFLFAMMAAMVVASPLGGRLSEWIGARRTVSLGSAISALGMLSLAVPSTPGSTRLVLSLVALGVGLGLSVAPSQAAALGAIAAEKSGMAAAAMSTVRYLGGIAGVATLGAVLAGGEVASRHRLAVGTFVVPLILAIVASFGLPGRPPRL